MSLFATGAFAAAPGDGFAIVAPPENLQAGTKGTWTITYTTNDQFNGGTVRVTIPSGWTAPQQSSSTSPGYVTVSSTAPTPLAESTVKMHLHNAFTKLNVRNRVQLSLEVHQRGWM